MYNRSDAPLSLSGLSLQYGSATGTGPWQMVNLSGTVAAGGYFLVGFVASASDGGAVNTIAPDLSTTVNLSASGGKLALVSGNTPLTGACPLGPQVLDALGFGASNCSETRPVASSGNTRPLVRADAVACVDTNDNASDFVAANVSPRNSATPPSACGCTHSVSLPTVPFPVSADGGVQLAPPPQLARPTFRWQAMPDQHVCELEARDALIPSGMSRKDFLERSLTEVILHEVGHTLGLRHNFKGSLGGATSVMDYNADGDALSFNDKPGAYDVAAVKLLYGLSTQAPTQPFCTDEDTLTDAECERFDTGANPLTTDVGPRFQAKLRQALTGQRGLEYADLWEVTRYVRAPRSEAQRLEALDLLVGDVAPPLKAEVIALGPTAGGYADFYNAVLLANLFAAPKYRDPVQRDVAMDDASFRARLVQVARDALKGTDGYRSALTMRTMVDVLKAVQHADAYLALTDARGHLVSLRASATPQGQVTIDDLVRRIDLATSPYFY